MLVPHLKEFKENWKWVVLDFFSNFLQLVPLFDDECQRWQNNALITQIFVQTLLSVKYDVFLCRYTCILRLLVTWFEVDLISNMVYTLSLNSESGARASI